jgi:hypothetical protein
MDQKDIVSQLEKNVKRGSALDTLMQVDAVLDNLNIYAYKNWIEGEIADGPHIERYWVTVTLMYPYKLMPDPDGAKRITDNGGRVFYAQDELTTAAKLVEPEDRDPEGDPRRPNQPAAKKIKRKVWLVTLELPRSFMDSMTTDKIKVDDMAIDTDAVEDAYDDGLGDEDVIQAD